MRKITVEELEIIVTAKIEQYAPQIKKAVKQTKQAVMEAEKITAKATENLDFNKIGTKVSEAVQTAKKHLSSLGNTNIDKTLQNQFDKAGLNVEKYQGKLQDTKNKLSEVYQQMDHIQNKTWKQMTPEGIEIGNTAIEPTVNRSLGKNKEYQDLISKESKLNELVLKLQSELSYSQQQYAGINKQIQQASNKQNVFTNVASKLKSELGSAGKKIESLKGTFNKLPNIANKVNKSVQQMSNKMGNGIKHVMKYAMALFSLRGIYSVLSNAAQSWLSSQNSGAKQLSANIDYMKYAMGSAFAPVIQYVTGLVYNLMKAIQSVVYSLFKVNIFANASANSYQNMAANAKKAKKETQSLAGVHDEINNITETKTDDEDSGSSKPNLDLSGIDNQMSPLSQKLSDFFKPLIESWNKYGAGLIEQIRHTAGQVGELVSAVWKSFENIITNGTVYTILENILAIIGNIAQAFANAWKYNGNGDAIIQNIANALNNLLTVINNVVKSDGFQAFLDFVVEKFREISEKIASINWEPLINALTSIGTVIGTVAISVLSGLVDIFKWLVENPIVAEIIAGIAVAIGILSTAYGIWATVTGVLAAVSTALNIAISPLVAIVAAIIAVIALIVAAIMNWDSIMKALATTWEWIKQKASEIFTAIADFFKGIWDGIKNVVVSVWNWIKDFFISYFETVKIIFFTVFNTINAFIINIWNGISSFIGNVINGIKNTISNILNAISSVWNNIWNGIKNTVTNIWNGIWGSIKSVINSILGGIEGFVNGIVRGINVVLRGISQVANAVGSLIGLNPINLQLSTISLPRLAKGGVLTEATAVIAGEYPGAKSNPEIVTPQNTMKDSFRDVLSEIDLGNGNQPIRVQIYLGAKQFVDEVIDGIREKERRTGKALIKVGV